MVHLAEKIIKFGMRIVLVNPYLMNKNKELDDNYPTKNDRKVLKL